MKELRIYNMKGLRISHFLLDRESGQSHSPNHLRQYAAGSNIFKQNYPIYYRTELNIKQIYYDMKNNVLKLKILNHFIFFRVREGKYGEEDKI